MGSVLLAAIFVLGVGFGVAARELTTDDPVTANPEQVQPLSENRTTEPAATEPPPTQPPATKPPSTKEPAPAFSPAEGDVLVVGDSLTFQALAHGMGHDAPADVDISAWMGWTVDDAQPIVDDAVATRRLDVLVVALGTNDASPTAPAGDGWSEYDVAGFRQMISTVDLTVCVVLVLPGHGAAVHPVHAAEIDEAQNALAYLAAERRNQAGRGATIVVDWQRIVDDRPDILGSDGIHLADPGSGASASSAEARFDAYWSAVRSC